MLDSRERINYGQQLKAPAGYKLDKALAATYSLDLDALTACTLALHLQHSLDDEPVTGDRAVFLECVEALRSRMLVIHHPSALKCSPRYNRVLGLLEPMLVQAKLPRGPEGAFSSFHPKFWLLSFSHEDSSALWMMRLVILTRNISFDRSWDLAVSFDGVVGKDERRMADGLASFIESVTPGDHRAFVEDLCGKLARVQWTTPEHFSSPRFLPGLPDFAVRGGNCPVDIDGTVDELLVAAPFVDASQLEEFGLKCGGPKTLVSRAETLDALGTASTAGWRSLVLSDAVVSGEEKLEQVDAKPQDLHAKLIVSRKGQDTVWHLGSANFTNAALGRRGASPRNTELMVRMKATGPRLSPGKLLSDLMAAGILVAHEFSDPPPPDPERDSDLRRLVHALCCDVRWSLSLEREAADLFTVTLHASSLPVFPRNFGVLVELAGHVGQKNLRGELRWKGIPLCDVSAFVRIQITKEDDGFTKEFVVKSDLLGRWPCSPFPIRRS